VIGRYANRIANGTFSLDGTAYRLPITHPPNSLHGGTVGFDKLDWRASPGDRSLRLEVTSPDGDQGYPGTLHVEVTYTVGDDDELRIEYRATTDAPTVVNLTNHLYWNLGASVDEHVLQIDASSYTPVDDTGVPTGELESVAGTRFDFLSPRAIGAEAYDQNFVLDGGRATLSAAGRTLELETTEPGLQVYTGDKLDPPRTGIALETQHFPDSPNHPNFPSTVLRPGETFASTTVYRLG